MSYVPEGLKTTGIDPAPADRTGPSGQQFGTRAWLRWAWRQLTSMRVALMLLMLLTVAALPGSFFPQRRSDAAAVRRYITDNPRISPVLDALGLFDVYSSPWFSAIYLLLFTSLIGCIVPRCIAHARALRSAPTPVPRRLAHFPAHLNVTRPESVKAVSQQVQAALGRGYRRQVTTNASGGIEISAEVGHARETGNLVFHLALVGLVIVTGWGQSVYYRGQAVVIAEQSFVNAPISYDSFEQGAWFDVEDQEPFRLRLDTFTSSFTETTRPEDFQADVTLFRPDGSESAEQIRVNAPLAVGSARVYLTGNGYAPVLTVRDASGAVAFTGPVMFLPQDGVYTSTGVVQAPDANDGDPQLAFNGTLFPTAVADANGEIVASVFPLPIDPVIVLNAWTGDLGLDEGVPRNLFVLDTSNLSPIGEPNEDGGIDPTQIVLFPGETVDLPDGQGSITFSEIRRFAALDVRWDPSVPWMGFFAGLAFLGLAASLFLPRRRLWFRIDASSEGSTIEAAALARGDDPRLGSVLERVLKTVSDQRKESTKETSEP